MTAGRTMRYIGVDGSEWDLHGENMGAQGVYLTSLRGFYHPVRLPMTQKPAYMRGAKPGPSKTDPSVLDIKVFTTAESDEEWEDVESAWWAAWSTDEDGVFVAGSRRGTFREQPIRLEHWPEEPFDFEPEDVQEWTVPVVAYSPGWRSQLLTSTWEVANPHLFLANPGDIEIWPQFAGWGHGETINSLPDGIAGESIDLSDVEIVDGEHWLIDTDQMQMVAETVTDTQLAARFAGMRFRHPIPPGTVTPVDTAAQVSISGATAETEIKAYCQPLHQRPWG